MGYAFLGHASAHGPACTIPYTSSTGSILSQLQTHIINFKIPAATSDESRLYILRNHVFASVVSHCSVLQLSGKGLPG